MGAGDAAGEADGMGVGSDEGGTADSAGVSASSADKVRLTLIANPTAPARENNNIKWSNRIRYFLMALLNYIIRR